MKHPLERPIMHTPLDIDDDPLTTASSSTRFKGVAEFVPFPPRDGVAVTNEQVNALRDAEGI
jgi:hypothetical protein